MNRRTDGQTVRRSRGRRRGGTDSDRVRLHLTLNGEPRELLVEGYKTLLEVLREDTGLTGTKHGCELGECGACAVLLNGAPALACLTLAVTCQDADVTTIEGLASGGDLHPLQAAFADHGGSQCGYCTSGMILTARHLLERDPDPSREAIAEALSGNLCRCTGYLQIIDAVEAAAATMRGERGDGRRGAGSEERAVGSGER